MATGPSAVAVGPGGGVFVLDRLNGRVLRLGERAVEVVAQVPIHAEGLAVASDSFTGAGSPHLLLAAWSPLRARVWLRSAGKDAGEVAVPRALRLARDISLSNSHQVLIHNAHQETYRLGSPSTVQSLAAVLHSRREGAILLPDSTGVQVRRRPADGRVELLLVEQADRSRIIRRIPLHDVVMGAQLVGSFAGGVCLRLEKAARSAGLLGEILVRREALCVRLTDGAVLLRQALPAPGSYLPRTELAVGGEPPRLAWIHPTAEGLVVRWRAIPRAAASEEVSP